MNYIFDCNSWKNLNTKTIQFFSNVFDYLYRKTDDAIIAEFGKTSSEEVIERRIHLLNGSYSTRVPVKMMCKHIQGIIGLDDMIKKGSPIAVELLAQCKDNRYFVFATKYCCFGNPKEYPIYDSLSSRVLEWFNERDRFYSKNRFRFDSFRGSLDYIGYKDAVNSLIEHYKLEKQDYKELDKYLWLVGKHI